MVVQHAGLSPWGTPSQDGSSSNGNVVLIVFSKNAQILICSLERLTHIAADTFQKIGVEMEAIA